MDRGGERRHVRLSWRRIPERDAIRRRLTALWDYPRYGTPFKKRGQYFFFKNDGLQNQAVLYRQPSIERRARPSLLDPNVLSPDGTVALSTLGLSEDARYLAYAIAASGSDWNDIHVRDVATGQDLPDLLRWVKFSGLAWTHDHAGFFYSRYPARPTPRTIRCCAVNRFHRLYYHRLGTPQAADQLVYERPDQPDWGVRRARHRRRPLPHALPCGSAPTGAIASTTWTSTIRCTPTSAATPVKLLDDFDASYGFVANHETAFYFRTDLDAPRGRLVAIDVRHPERAHWREIIPQAPDVLESVTLVHDTLRHDLPRGRTLTLAAVPRSDGSLRRHIPLPDLGTGVSSRSSPPQDTELFFAFTTYLDPTTIFRHDFSHRPDRGRSRRRRSTSIHPATSPSRCSTRARTAPGSRCTSPTAGTSCGTAPTPTYLYGYGGFDISLTPGFSPSVLVWLEMGGVFAVANLRGGGEYGEAWHEAGMHEKKQTVFDDFLRRRRSG